MADRPAALPLDSNLLRGDPLPEPDNATDKNGRGRVMVIGGCALVPGGIQLTAEAAFRAGAGKVQVATIERAALSIGIAMPEVAVIALSETAQGEIAAAADEFLTPLDHIDAVVVGPAMACADSAGALVDRIANLTHFTGTLVLDAAALLELPRRAATLALRSAPLVLTPHVGEMAAMLDMDADAVEADRVGAALRASDKFQAVVVLKGATSFVAAPARFADGEERLFAYAGGGVGLATGGSGDVLAGMVAGLAARGATPLSATLWAVWLHGEAGRRCAERSGPLGYLARELLREVPPLMRVY